MNVHKLNKVVINADSEAVYGIICDSDLWPEIFEPCQMVAALHRGKDGEHIQVSALVNGQQQTWESKRRFLRNTLSINVDVVKPMPLVKAMQTRWLVIPLNRTQSTLVLEHQCEICEQVENLVEGVHNREDAAHFISQAIDNNSTTELQNIKQLLEGPKIGAHVEKKRDLSHSVVCESSAEKVYSLITNLEKFPDIYSACISAKSLELHENRELIEIEAMQNGKVVSWKAQRTYYPEIFRVDFFLPIPMPFLKSMSGTWRVIPLNEHKCVLSAIRSFELVDDVTGIREEITTLEQASEFMNRFIDENIANEMLAIQSFAARGEATFSMFNKRSFLPFSPDEVYQAFVDVSKWPEILPHCQEVEIIYDDSENQEFIMQIRTDIGTEEFRSIRKCNANDLSISYFQPSPPEVLNKHSGSWVFNAVPGGTEIISEHIVDLNTDICIEKFAEKNLENNKQKIKKLINKNSQTTVEATGKWLEKQLNKDEQ